MKEGRFQNNIKWPDAQPGLDAQRKHAKRLEEHGGKKRFIVKKVEKAVY